ncbi:unnamed protein product [Gemmataceae bacterium]|nr:unnamed protein product [Gemmataceae bacterium]VTT99577.1 unnamed protein product [Gemmataceae bacterium]
MFGRPTMQLILAVAQEPQRNDWSVNVLELQATVERIIITAE